MKKTSRSTRRSSSTGTAASPTIMPGECNRD
jgi:hypothetical protein